MLRDPVVLAALCAVVTTYLLLHTAQIITRPHGSFATDLYYMRALFRWNLLWAAAGMIGWLMQPTAASWLESLRRRTSPGTKHILTATSLLAACVFVSAFLIFFGRHQFGSWDYNILIEVAWRQLLGQVPFVDFVTPTPPFFNWTSALAFHLFGVTWDATLYFAAVFASATLVWCFLLLRQLKMGTFAALGTSTVMQIAAMLTCCFWWYNNSTLILSALFFLASILLARAPRSRLGQASFVVLLGLLPLTKPNIAGVTAAGSIALLLWVSRDRLRILLLVAAGLGLVALLFVRLDIPFGAMLATYRGVAKERGGFSTFGFQELDLGERRMAALWMVLLCAPLLTLWPKLRDDLQARRWRDAAFLLYFPLAAVVALYGLAGNGEFRDVECTLLIGALSLLAFVYQANRRGLQRLTVALLCAMAVSDLYVGAARLRVFTVGLHLFSEWKDNHHTMQGGFLNHLQTTGTMVESHAEVQDILHSHPGTVFFGPRLDFEYAVNGLTSPTGWVSFFQPGTAFGRAQTQDIISAWDQHRFDTLIFMKSEYTFYPPSFLQDIRQHYRQDDHYSLVTVYRRHPGAWISNQDAR